RCHNVLLKLNHQKAKKKSADKVTNKVIGIEMDIVTEVIDMASDMGLDIKGILLLAKWFKESVLTIDEFFSSIHNKVTMLIKNNTLLPIDYSVAFKVPRETGAETQLAVTQDFTKFKAECLKLAAKNVDMGIYIVIMQAKKK
ncbi:23175_t:CDS:2, partial [Dentiscutata erythropus]